MSDYHLDGIVEVVVDAKTYGGTAFGTVVNSGAQCVFNPRLTECAGIEVGNTYRCKLGENPKVEARARTPYSASYILPDVAPEPEPVEPPADKPVETPTDAFFGAVQTAMDFDGSENVLDAATLRSKVAQIVDNGGVHSVKSILNQIYGPADFLASSEEHKVVTAWLNNALAGGKIYRFGCVNRPKGNMSRCVYTAYPDKVRIVWAG